MPTRRINGREFSLEPIHALTSFALQPLIAPVAGRIVGLVLKALGSEEGLSISSLTVADMMSKAPDLAGEIGLAFGAIKPDDLLRVTRSLFGQASCGGIPFFPVAGDDRKFNELFAGKTRDLWELLWFAVQVNYPDFLPARVGSVAPAQAESPSATSTTSVGDGPSIA